MCTPEASSFHIKSVSIKVKSENALNDINLYYFCTISTFTLVKGNVHCTIEIYIDSYHLIFASTWVCVSAAAWMSPGYSSGWRAGGWSFTSIMQDNTTHTWDQTPNTLIQALTLMYTLKGLIIKPLQSGRDHDTGDNIKRPNKRELIREEKNVNLVRKWVEKTHRELLLFREKDKVYMGWKSFFSCCGSSHGNMIENSNTKVLFCNRYVMCPLTLI